MSLSLSARIESLVIRLAQEFNDVRARAGNLATLSTVNKSNLVAAINELHAALVSPNVINDLVVATTSTYSSSRIVALLGELKTEILGGAGPAFDTLLEIQQALQSGSTGLDALLTAVNNRVRFDGAQILSVPQQVQARANIGAASVDQVGPDRDFVAIFNAALV